MNGTRELINPFCTVKVEQDDAGDDHVRLRFKVLGSTLGPVEVVMYAYEVDALMLEIEEALGG